MIFGRMKKTMNSDAGDSEEEWQGMGRVQSFKSFGVNFYQ
jgi:hypothetical protein